MESCWHLVSPGCRAWDDSHLLSTINVDLNLPWSLLNANGDSHDSLSIFIRPVFQILVVASLHLCMALISCHTYDGCHALTVVVLLCSELEREVEFKRQELKSAQQQKREEIKMQLNHGEPPSLTVFFTFLTATSYLHSRLFHIYAHAHVETP